jgi:short-subunit dehydrogenase
MAITFKDKVVWVIGASSGIGEQLCYELNRKGARLIISSRNSEKLELVNLNLPQNPGTAGIVTMDLAEHAALPGLVRTAWNHFGHIDVIFCNAGIAVRDWALSTSAEVDKKIMDVNYFGTVIITKSILPFFIKRGKGNIVVTSSLSGKYGVPKTSPYAASKHALHGFFETLRSETYKDGIKITLVVPGIIKTRITAHAITGSGDKYGKVEKSFEQAYPAQKAALKMIRAAEKEKEEVFVGGTEGITLVLNRLSPYLLRRFIRNHPIRRMRRIKSFFKRK